MAKKKGNVRTSIRIKSTKSSHYYTTSKNKANTTTRLELKKYDPTLRKHVLYKEAK